MPDARLELTIEISGDVQLHRLFAGRIRAVENFRGFFNDVAADFYATEAQVFATGGGAEGLEPWRPLTERYARWKARKFPGARLLVQRGLLRDALTRPDAPDSVYELSDDQVVLGAHRMTPDGRWDLGLIHQRGRQDGSMPARPPLRISRKQRSRWMRFLREHISGED